MNVFVTGGSGFVGGAAVRRLLAQGHQVRAMSRSERSDHLIRTLGAVPVRCNLEDANAEHVTGCDVVIHAAAYVEPWGPSDAWDRVNVVGTQRMLLAARGAGSKRFIHIGTEAALVHGQDLHEAAASSLATRVRSIRCWPHCRVSFGLGVNSSQTSHSLLDQFIRFATAEMGNNRAGRQSVLNRLSELLFVEIIRWHMDQPANSSNTGWLAGLRDPLIGRALTLLHARPAHAWTLEELASQAGASRSALADRFAHLVGCPPIQYLTQWRMQLAAKRLADRSAKISVIASEVGYESEAAFSRAFKKFVGQSPGQWRSVAS